MIDTTNMQTIVHIIGDLDGYYETVEDYEDLKTRVTNSNLEDWIELDLGHGLCLIPIRRIECLVPFNSPLMGDIK